LTQVDDGFHEDEERVCPSNDDPGRNEEDELFAPIIPLAHGLEPPLDCQVTNHVDVDVSGNEETYETVRVTDSDDERPSALTITIQAI
jgi:hypothetical protein